MNTHDEKLTKSFINSMSERIRFFSNGRLSEAEINYLADKTVKQLDFNNKWQMHKGLGYFARKVVDNYIAYKENCNLIHEDVDVCAN